MLLGLIRFIFNNTNPIINFFLAATCSCRCIINAIDDFCLEKIFQYLEPHERIRIERVCKRWSYVSKSSWIDFREIDAKFLRDKVIVKFEEKLINEIICNLLSRCGKYLKKIDLEIHYIIYALDWNFLLNLLAKFCENIQVLKIHGFCSISSSSSSSSSSYILDPPDTDEVLRKIFLKNTHLKTVFIESIRITGLCLNYLPFKSLDTLSIFANEYHINKYYLCEALSKLKFLKSCTIKGNYHCICLMMNALSSYGNAEEESSLSRLRIERTNCAQSQRLKLSNYLCKMKNLREIEFCGVEINSRDLLSLPCHLMEKLVLEYFEFENYDDILNTMSSSASAAAAASLQFENLQTVLIINSVSNIDNRFCKALSKFKKLKFVLMANCDLITNEGILMLSRLSGLEKLIIDSCDNVTEEVKSFFKSSIQLNINSNYY